MVLRVQIVLAASIIFPLALASPAAADPISFQYSVQVVSAGLGGQYPPQPYFPHPFELVATFDDRITAAIEHPGTRLEYYGRVRFSPLPDFLPVPSAYADRPLIDDFPRDSSNFAFTLLEGGFGHMAVWAGSYINLPSTSPAIATIVNPFSFRLRFEDCLRLRP
jgi:hypothetical protein